MADPREEGKSQAADEVHIGLPPDLVRALEALGVESGFTVSNETPVRVEASWLMGYHDALLSLEHMLDHAGFCTEDECGVFPALLREFMPAICGLAAQAVLVLGGKSQETTGQIAGQVKAIIVLQLVQETTLLVRVCGAIAACTKAPRRMQAAVRARAETADMRRRLRALADKLCQPTGDDLIQRNLAYALAALETGDEGPTYAGAPRTPGSELVN